MTQVPPPRIPGAGSGQPEPDPALDAYLDAFLRAHVAHERAVRPERRRYAAELRELRRQYGDRQRARQPRPQEGEPPRWVQPTLGESDEEN